MSPFDAAEHYRANPYAYGRVTGRIDWQYHRVRVSELKGRERTPPASPAPRRSDIARESVLFYRECAEVRSHSMAFVRSGFKGLRFGFSEAGCGR